MHAPRKRPRSPKLAALLIIAAIAVFGSACDYNPILGFAPSDLQAFNALHGTNVTMEDANAACAQLNAAGDPTKCQKTVDYLNGLKLSQARKKPVPPTVAAVSWYDPAGLGGMCASGPCPPNNSFSCAHKTAQFGTLLRLTKNGRSIVCTVVDRGPYISGRAVDLFPAPAEALGLKGPTRNSGPGVLSGVTIAMA